MSYSAYTDGSCIKNPGVGGYGAVLLNEKGEVIQELSGFLPNTTNNKAEMTAVIRALEWFESPIDITIYTDSEYTAKGMNEWITGWKRNGWRTSNKKQVLNKELWQELDSLCQKHKVKFVWIARSSHEHNKTADRLANGRARSGE